MHLQLLGKTKIDMINTANKQLYRVLVGKVADNWSNNGMIPFDVEVVDNVATIMMVTETIDEAKNLAVSYVENGWI